MVYLRPNLSKMAPAGGNAHFVTYLKSPHGHINPLPGLDWIWYLDWTEPPRQWIGLKASDPCHMHGSATSVFRLPMGQSEVLIRIIIIIHYFWNPASWEGLGDGSSPDELAVKTLLSASSGPSFAALDSVHPNWRKARLHYWIRFEATSFPSLSRYQSTLQTCCLSWRPCWRSRLVQFKNCFLEWHSLLCILAEKIITEILKQ